MILSEFKISLVWLPPTSHTSLPRTRVLNVSARVTPASGSEIVSGAGGICHQQWILDNVLWSLFTQPRPRHICIISGHNSVQMIEYLSVSAKLSHLDVIRRYHNKLRRCLTHDYLSHTTENKQIKSLSMRPGGGSSTIKKSNYLFDISSRWLKWYGYLQNYPKHQMFKVFAKRGRRLYYCLNMNI